MISCRRVCTLGLAVAKKCMFSPFPPARAHLDRVKAAEGADVVEACPEDDDDDDDQDDGMTAAASKGLVSVLLLPLLVLHHLH